MNDATKFEEKTLQNFLQFLTKSKTLYITFFITIFLTFCFGLAMHVGGFQIIDEMYNAENIRRHVAAMTPAQKSIHSWLTGTVDVLYPFAYAAFFIGIAVKCFGRLGIWLAIPSLLAIPADLTEGFAQIMILQGHDSFISLKVWATPIKLAFFAAGLFITVIGLLLMIKKSFRTDET